MLVYKSRKPTWFCPVSLWNMRAEALIKRCRWNFTADKKCLDRSGLSCGHSLDVYFSFECQQNNYWIKSRCCRFFIPFVLFVFSLLWLLRLFSCMCSETLQFLSTILSIPHINICIFHLECIFPNMFDSFYRISQVSDDGFAGKRNYILTVSLLIILFCL